MALDMPGGNKYPSRHFTGSKSMASIPSVSNIFNSRTISRSAAFTLPETAEVSFSRQGHLSISGICSTPTATLIRSYHVTGVSSRRRPSVSFRDREKPLHRKYTIAPSTGLQNSLRHTNLTHVFGGSNDRGSLRPERTAAAPAERSGSAPPLTGGDDARGAQEEGAETPGDREAPGQAQKFDRSSQGYRPFFLSAFLRGAVRQLASFPLAIGMLFWIAGLCALGTIIEQGETVQAYQSFYPEDKPLFGFLTWRVILGLSLDHIYTAPYFLGLLLLLAFALVACSTTRQWPMVRVAQRWVFYKKPEPILKLETADSLPNASIDDLAVLLSANGFQVFMRNTSLYAFKGLVGRLAPIGVHAALLLVMGGGLYSAIGGYHGTTMTPQGLEFYVGDVLYPRGGLSSPSDSFNLRVRVNRFFIDYRDNGDVKQFYSDLSVIDLQNRELVRKTISVNDPLRCRGVTLYQTDWGMSALQLRVDGSDPFNLPMAALDPGSDQKLFGTFLPLGQEGAEKKKGISILARDLQSVVVYDTGGQFSGVRRLGSGKSMTVDGVELVIDDVIPSTGLEVKMDPSVPLVYAGFGALMLTSAISYLSHAQVWALQEGSTLHIGGKSNRARLGFKKELNDVMDMVPEVEEGEVEDGMRPQEVTKVLS